MAKAKSKIKRVGTISEFMAGKHKARQVDWKPIVKVGVTVGVVALSLTFGDVSFAAAGAVQGVTTAKVVEAFQPLIELVRAISYPVGLVMMLGGGLTVMIGNSDRGFAMIQKAGLGYVLIQMLPMLMDLLVEIAKAL